MAIAICDKCQKDVLWSNRHGNKLADVVTACCGASARSKPRKAKSEPIRANLPRAVALVQHSRTSIYPNSEWLGEPHNTVIYLKANNMINIAGKWGDHVIGELVETWRICRYFELIHGDVGYWHTVRVDEDDYQRLLRKAQSSVHHS